MVRNHLLHKCKRDATRPTATYEREQKRDICEEDVHGRRTKSGYHGQEYFDHAKLTMEIALDTQKKIVEVQAKICAMGIELKKISSTVDQMYAIIAQLPAKTDKQ